ncbi:MAG: tRNA (adenosine(37)-N6)-threonylcarbamoyltransferase complex ATPase subunit type 1 TsaE [Fimbriimonadaceae bacterium]|nr:tRNA (adenosine(37)-N6)-threonylcarbamoyltransferase complex ATPase subunit type 1 TsaE [Chitinophagales bacterium]
MQKKWTVQSVGELEKVAAEILAATPAKKFAVYGNMGAGKTTFIKSICKQLGTDENISSPTFAIVHEYAGREKIYHFDLYRINKIEELIEIGFEEYLENDAYVFIEWPEVVEHMLADFNFATIKITEQNDGSRIIEVSGE